MNKNTDVLVGKTITKINQQAINCWRIEYELVPAPQTQDPSDTSHKGHIFLWTESDGPYGLGQLWLSDKG